MNNKTSVTVRSVDSFEENLNEIQSLIRSRAFELFLERGKRHGLDQDDWFRATADVLQQPLMTLSETEAQITMVLSLPGLDVSDLDILSTRDSVLILGNVKTATALPLERTVFKHIQLPRFIEPDSLRAEFQAGTLRCVATIQQATQFLHAKTA